MVRETLANAETLKTIAADPRHLGAEIGFIAILHSWGQALTHHPHIHCVVPGGGLSPDGRRWIACPPASTASAITDSSPMAAARPGSR
jgi:hypothetical protein